MPQETRIAVVTGAASGIGAATVDVLATAGYRVISLDRSPAVEDAAARTQHINGFGEAHVVELSDFTAAAKLIERIAAKYGQLDVLVNNAGIHPKKDGRKVEIEEIDIDQWNTVMAVNLAAPFVLCQAVLPVMKRRQWGRIINVVSRAGRTYSPMAGSHYSASKAGLIGFTRVLAAEAGPFGITANCVAPGRVVTPLGNQGIGHDLHRKYASEVAVGRVGTSEEIAASIRYFASDEAGYTTGAVIDVNGGGFMG